MTPQTQNSHHLNQRGTTLTETLIGASLMMIGILAMTGVMVGMNKASSKAKVKIGDNKQLQSLADSIRRDLGSFQVDFSHPVSLSQSSSNVEFINQVLAPEKLSMAWDNNVSTTVQECPNCPGRYGFVIQPFESTPGVYLITLRRTHKSWDVPYKDFSFIAGSR